MKTFLKFLDYYALIPLAASIPAFFANLSGLSQFCVILTPFTAALIYAAFRKKIDFEQSSKVNGAVFLFLLIVFTVLITASKGNVESVLMSSFNFLILPFAPMMLILVLMGKYMLLYVSALLTYAVSFLVSAWFANFRVRKMWIPCSLVLVCILLSGFMYLNRPQVKYGGHGFKYMRGYSSTDFTDYMVFSDNSKLVLPDHQPPFIIENEEDMPIMDGAEACYPLYAAFAKTLYKDIDKIELSALETDEQYRNGRKVTFTNSVFGFSRLLMGGQDPEKYGYGTDMFFGARPSSDQMEMAKDFGVELEVTPIGQEAFVFFVEENNPIDGLTAEQLKAIYHGDITSWNELGGKNQEILAFQRPKNSGSQTMMEYFMGDIPLKEPQTYERVDGMTGVIKEVAQYANQKGAIGYSFRYFLEELNQEKGVKVLSVNGVYPTLENIENGSYPLIVDVCLITRKNETNPYVERIKEYILSEDGQTIVRKTGYAGISE